MKALKKYISRIFIAVTILMALSASAFDSIFDEIAGNITNVNMMYLILVLFFVMHIIILGVGGLIFSRLTNKRIEDENTRAVQEKSMLFANIAHDLKTPMTTIIGFSKALADGEVADPHEQKELLYSIYTKSKQANELLDVMFQYTKLNSRDFQLNLAEQDVERLLREVTALHYSEFESKNIEVSIDTPNKPIICRVDKIEFSRAISNLIVNAFQHNSDGSKVLIRLTYDKKVTIVVADNGECIPSSKEKEIFEPFVCGDVSRNSKNGSGLGLAITRAIIEKHGGEISICNNNEGYTKGFMIRV